MPLLVVIFFGVIAARTLLFQEGYFLMHDDLQMMRQLEMEKCFLDGQIPCRWVPDMGYGFGFPLFNFYPPLPYLIGQGIRLLGFSFVATVKLNFALALIGSGIGMYFLAKEFFGRAGGVLSAIFYIWAPYHSVEIFVRGAMNENWALVWFPFIFLLAYKLIRSNKENTNKYLILLSLAWFGLFTSHNLMVMIFTPLFGVWILFLLFLYGYKRLPSLVFSGIFAFALAAFFTLPALLENGYTHVQSQLQGYFEYSAHFVTLNQLFLSRFWGYGGSAWDTFNDEMSFSIGHFHWVISLVIVIVALFKTFAVFRRGVQKKSLISELRKHPILLFTFYILLAGWFAAFMAHGRSTFIYERVSQLQFVQFPWRFLTLVIFTFSFAIGVIPRIFARLKSVRIPIIGFVLAIVGSVSQTIVLALLVVALVIFNWHFFLPFSGKMGPLTDEDKFSGVAWELQQAGGAWDYLPTTAKEAPREFKTGQVDVIEGDVSIINPQSGTYWTLFKTEADTDSVLRINTFAFPGWRIAVNGNIVEYFIPDNENWGRMYVKIPSGSNQVYVQLYNTPIRTVANIISLIAWGTLFVLIFVKGSTPKLRISS